MCQAWTTAHLKAHFPPPLSPLILLRGDDGWMYQTMWIWKCVCAINLDNFVHVVFLCSSHFSHAEYHSSSLIQCNALFLQWTSPTTCGCTASDSAKLWVNMHTAPLRKTAMSLVFSIRKKWLSFAFQLCLLHSQILFIICYTLVCTLLGPKKTDKKILWHIAYIPCACEYSPMCVWHGFRWKTNPHITLVIA